MKITISNGTDFLTAFAFVWFNIYWISTTKARARHWVSEDN